MTVLRRHAVPGISNTKYDQNLLINFPLTNKQITPVK